MALVVTTPTGNIGRELVAMLLDRKKNVTIIARHPEKAVEFSERGALVLEGRHDDPEFVVEATRGAEALFWLTPPDMTSKDLQAHYRKFARAGARAIEENRIPHVVHLSSVGADLEEGSGPVLGLHYNEQILEEVSENIVHLRPAYFMENTLGQINAIKQTGNMYATFEGNTRIPMVATRDIAECAADFMGDLTWRGREVVEIQGAGEVSFNEISKVLGEVLGRDVSYVQVGEEQLRQAMTGMGASDHMADLINELARGVSSGKVKFHTPRSKENTTPTNYAVFAKDVFKPMYDHF